MASKNEILASLEQQLRDRGADIPVYQSLLKDYMFFYTMQKRMQADIRKRGFEINTVSATGKEYVKENPSVKQSVMYNQRMLAILKELGLTTETCRPPSESDGDLG